MLKHTVEPNQRPNRKPQQMNPLPDDIVLYHILPWLPPKSLLRFRCVCKSWDSFIRHPSFLRLRRATAATHGHLLFLSPDPYASLIATSQPHVFSAPLHAFQPDNIDMAPARATHVLTLPNLCYSKIRVQCVNGLLCFHPRSTTLFSSRHDAFTLIGNPTTREVVSLPVDDTISGEFLVSTHFGYDPERDEFKVLRLVKYHGSHAFKVFTVGVDSSWRMIAPERPFVPMHCLLYRKRGLCVNGALHWTYSSNVSFFDSLNIVVFDLGSEQFRVMPAPLGYLYKERKSPHLQFPDLVEIGGCLSLIGYSGSVLNLWILKDCQAQVWEQRSIVLPCGIVEQQRVVFPLCRVPTGEILLLPYFLSSRVRVIYYDMDKMTSRSVVVMEMPQPLWPDQVSGEVDIFFYQESFRLLK